MPPDDGAAADTSFSFVAATLEDTLAWGRRLGRALRVGDVIGLVGPLGAGKTTLTQSIAEGAGVPPTRHVASPTFALVNEHPGRVPFLHADLYRVRSPAELAETRPRRGLRPRGVSEVGAEVTARETAASALRRLEPRSPSRMQ